MTDSKGLQTAVEAVAGIVSVSVFSLWESCERTTYFVRIKTEEGLTREVEAHQTGSIYTDHVGLSKEEARDRALIDAATWGDFLGIKPKPFIEDGVTHEPSMSLSTYTYQREMSTRRQHLQEQARDR